MIRAPENGVRRPVDAAATPACGPAAPDGCATCGDEALQARVVGVDDAAASADVVLLEGGSGAGPARDGARLAVALDLVDGVAIGDLVLVHQGFAICRVEAP